MGGAWGHTGDMTAHPTIPTTYTGGEKTLVDTHEYRGSTITVYSVTESFVTEETYVYDAVARQINYTGEVVTRECRSAHHKAVVGAKTDRSLVNAGFSLRGDATPKGLAKAVKAAHHVVDLQIAYDRDLPACQAAMGYSGKTINPEHLVNASTPVGTKVAFYSRGQNRTGIVSKVGRTNVEVAYVTPSNPNNITRKTHPFSAVEVVA